VNFEQILSDLENKIYYPVYFLYGEEPYFIDEITEYIEHNVLSETEKEFNQTILYGRDTDVQTIIDQARRYPMMSNYQVVIVKEAQGVDDIDELQPYVERPLKSTLLLIAYKYKKLDKRTSFAKSIDKNGVLFEAGKLYESQVPQWITAQLRKAGYTITPKAVEMLGEFLGTGLGKIQNELEKLTINLPQKSTITEEIIERNIGISKEYNVFELQQALGTRDILKANRITNYFASSPKQNPMVVVLALLFSYFVKLMIYHQLEDKSRNQVASALSINPFFVKDYAEAAKNFNQQQLKRVISLLREYDLRVKGINNNSTSEGELLKELVYRILH
jgi:DNA polymerase-3 subunit delta